MAKTTNNGVVGLDKFLTNYAVSIFSQTANFIADKIAPVIQVNKDNDKYLIQTAKGFFDDNDEVRAEGTEAGELDPLELSSDSYACQYFSKRIKNKKNDIMNEDSIVMSEFRKVDGLMRWLHMRKEKLVSDLVFSASNYTSGAEATTFPCVKKWDLDDGSATDPMDDINTYAAVIQSKTGIPQDQLTLTISNYTLNKLKKQPAILNFMSAMSNKNVTTGLLAEYFGVKEVLIGNSYINSAQEGKTISTSQMWGKHALLSYIQPAQSMNDPSFAKQFIWNGSGDSKYAGRGIVGIKKYTIIEKETSFVEIGAHVAAKLTSADSAFLITDVVS